MARHDLRLIVDHGEIRPHTRDHAVDRAALRDNGIALGRADIALYTSKNKGRNQVTFNARNVD